MDTSEAPGATLANKTGAFLIGYADIDAVWPEVRRLLEEHGSDLLEYYSLESIHTLLKNSFFQLWVYLEEGSARALALTSVTDYPRRTSLEIKYLAGRGALDLLPFLEQIENWGAALGADEVSFVGRQGWRRVLSKLGYEFEAIAGRKRLTPAMAPTVH